MVRLRGKKKNSSLELIGPALIPAVALTAVPRSPPPKAPSGAPIGLATAVFSSSFPRRRSMGEQDPSGEEAGFSDPESSLYDYQLMEEPGYSTVGFGTWPNQNRKSYSDRDKAPTPPFVRHASAIGVVSQSGNLYHIVDPEEDQAGPSDPDLYAVVMKGKGPGIKKGSHTSLDEDAASLDRTQRDVRKAMQAVHDMPVEETMMQLSASRQHLASHPGSSSGRGTMPRGDTGPTNDVKDDTDSEETESLTPSLKAAGKVPSTTQGYQNQPSLKESVKASSSPSSQDHAPPVKDPSYVSLKQDVQSPVTAVSSAASGSGRFSSRRSHTPRSAASFSLEMEVSHLKAENRLLQQEVATLKDVAAAIKVGDQGAAQELLQSQQTEELREENEVLKKAVGRLNAELSRYQAKFRPLSDEDRSKLQAIPSQGPVPAWLINKRYLAPLFLAYDDLIQEKEEAMRHSQQELQALKKRTEDVVRENQRQQLRGGGGEGAVSLDAWRQLQDQARLVLEENQILMEQLAVQQARVKDLCTTHMQEVSRLTKQLASSETQKEEAEREAEEMRRKFKDIKQRHDRVLMDAGGHMTMQDHINTVADLKRSVTEDKEQLEKDKEKMMNKLKASEEERKQQTFAVLEVSTQNKQLQAEVKALHKALRRSQNKLLLMHRAIQQSENKELVTQNELANVIRIVEKTALERDTAFKVVKEQQRDCKDTVNRMVGNSVVMGKMEERLKTYKQRASAKLQTVAEKLKDQDDSFNRQKQEYEREIRYLRLLLKEKEELIRNMEGDKKHVEEDLENMWQAASSENQRLKDTLCNSVYKLRQHSGLRAALDDEEELEKLVNFSD